MLGFALLRWLLCRQAWVDYYNRHALTMGFDVREAQALERAYFAAARELDRLAGHRLSRELDDAINEMLLRATPSVADQ
jgi:hypothetical protein